MLEALLVLSTAVMAMTRPQLHPVLKLSRQILSLQLPSRSLASLNFPSALFSVMLTNAAKTSKRAAGQTTKVKSDSGGVVTRVINQTVTTGKYRSSSKNSGSLLKGKIAGIVLGVVVALIFIVLAVYFLHKRKQKKAGIVSPEDKEPGEQVMEKKLDEDEVDKVGTGVGGGPANPGATTVPGEMTYGSEPANPIHGSTSVVSPTQNAHNGVASGDK